MNDDLRTLYGWVRGSRERLFAWAEGLPPEVYTLERPDFAHGSLRNIQAHVAGCYFWWTGRHGLGDERSGHSVLGALPADVPAMRAAFRAVDEVLEGALERFTDLDARFDLELGPGDRVAATRRWLVMHPITHEFHHKGQMLAIGRVLGHPYPPGAEDTDLALPL